jgi:hypothetical protein
MIEGKGLGNKKINRVGLSLSNQYDSKLRRLATACNIKHTTLAGLIIEKYLDNVQLVYELQKDYCTQAAYRVIPVNKNGQLEYVLSGSDDLK